MISQENLRFFNVDTALAGTLYRPQSPASVPAVVVIHAANGGLRTYPFYAHLSTALPAAGIAVLLYDRRGSGESGGSFETADFNLLASDTRAAVACLAAREDIDRRKIGLYGVSQGGWIAPLAAAGQSSVACLVIVSGCGVSPAEQMTYSACTALRQAGYPDEILARVTELRLRVDSYFRGELPRQDVLAELDRVQAEPWFEQAYLPQAGELPLDARASKWYYEFDFNPLPVWKQVRQPSLFIYGQHDRWVPVNESVNRFVTATSHLEDVTFVQIPRTDHLMTPPSVPESAEISGEVSKGYISVLIAWLRAIFSLNF